MDDEYYDADDRQESSLFCPLYPIISYPCCKASFSDFLITPPLFFGVLLPCCFLGNEWGNRRSAAKFQKEGESIKGVVADSRNWITTHESPQQNVGTVVEKHFELTVKYPAEGATLQSPKCSHIVRKKFLVSSMNYRTFNGNGVEIEILRMPASEGYDPRKAILVCSLLDSINPCWVLVLGFVGGIFWNIVWSSISCIAFMWAWPLALIIAFCANPPLPFKTKGLEGDILDRHDDGVETGSDISNNHDGVETGSDNNQSSSSILV